MLKYKKYLFILLSYILLNIVISSIYYFSNITYSFISILLFIINIIYISIISYIIANKFNKKGIFIGLLSGISISLVLFILSLIFKCNIGIKVVIYYLIIILVSIFSSILNKNIKK